MRGIGVGILALACAWGAGAPAAADVFFEIGDAGGLPATAQAAALGEPNDGLVDQIVGSLHGDADVDVYAVRLIDGVSFSATTEGQPDQALDTRLFLFDEDGVGVYANDDTDGTSILSTLPAGDPLGPTTGGLYYLVVASFGISPTDADGTFIFPEGPLEAVLGPQSMLPYASNSNSGSAGDYVITLTGVAPIAVPEPATAALLVAGGLCLACFARGRRRR